MELVVESDVQDNKLMKKFYIICFEGFEYLFEVFLHIIYCPINNKKKHAYSHLMIIDPDLLTQMRA